MAVSKRRGRGSGVLSALVGALLACGLTAFGEGAWANSLDREAAERAEWQEQQRRAREEHDRQEAENRQRHEEMIREQEEAHRRQQESMRQAASQRSSQAGLNAAMNAVTAGMLWSQCSSTKKWACGLAALTSAQALQSMGERSRTDTGILPKINVDPYQTKDFQASDFPGMDLGAGDGTAGGAGGPGRSPEAVQARKILNDLKGLGYEVDMDKEILHTPDGAMPFSAFSDAASAMEQLGATAEEIDEFMQSVAGLSVDSGPGVVAMDVDGGAGGGARFDRQPSSLDDSDPLGDYLRSLMAPSSKSKAEMVAGKSRMLGGEPIGVAADNIFDMVHRRYQQKAKQGLFIDAPDAQPQTQAPSRPRF